MHFFLSGRVIHRQQGCPPACGRCIDHRFPVVFALLVIWAWGGTTQSATAQGYDLSYLNKGALFSISSVLHDVDGDGDLDVVVTRREDQGIPSGIEWLENDGTGQFPRHEIYSDDTVDRPGDVAVCDCDNDGDLDFVIADRGDFGDGQLFWIQRQDDDSFIKWTIEAGADFERVAVADLNDDGLVDIVAVGFGQSTVNRYLNDGNLDFARAPIAENISQASLVAADDIDGDGDVDVVFSGADGRILLNNGDATFEPGPELVTLDGFGPSSARGLTIADLNGDDVLDVLTFSGLGSGGLYFLDGADSFSSTVIERVGIDLGGDIVVADFDGDGDQDIVRQNIGDNELTILYQDAPMEFRREVLDYNWDDRGSSRMAVGDLDEDGDLDLFFPENGNVDGDVSWYENVDGVLHRHQIHMQLRGARGPILADLDGDGDLDIVQPVADNIATEDEIIWFENRGEIGFVEWRVADSLQAPSAATVADLNGDGELDIVATARDDNDLLWYARDGLVWDRFVIEDNANAPMGLTTADIDGDTDVDVVLTSNGDAKVYWYENDGQAGFTRQIVDANLPEPFAVEAGDLDGDGDTDLMVLSTEEANAAVLYLNDGQGTFEREILLADVVATDVEIGDWDGSGGLDIVVAIRENQTADPDIILYSNEGDGTFAASTLVSDNRNVTSVRLGDIDDDGDLDLIAGNDNATPRVRVYTNVAGAAVPASAFLDDLTSSIVGIDVGDIDGDGILDFVAGDSRGYNLLLFEGTGGDPIAIEPVDGELPTDFSLEQNYPNPFNPVTTIPFSVLETADVTLTIFDVQGRVVETLVSGSFPSGLYEVRWDASRFAGGIYVYRLEAGSYREARVLAVLK